MRIRRRISARAITLAITFAGAFFAVSCAAPRPPELPCAVTVKAGVVHAATPEKAQAMANVLEDLAPAVHRALPGSAGLPVDVRIVSKMERANWGGATYTTQAGHWIELPDGAESDRSKATLVHELVHYQLGEDWSTLPGVLEEGLCDYIAHELVPSAAPLERAEYAVMLATAIDGSFRFDAPRVLGRGSGARFSNELMSYTVRTPIEVDELPSFAEALRYESVDLVPIRAQGVRGVLDALGYTIVSRVGVEALYGLCLRAKILKLRIVPARWLYQAAAIDPHDRSSWRTAVSGLFGEAEKLALLRRDALVFEVPQ